MRSENNFLKVIITNNNMIYYVTEIDNKNPKIIKGLIHKGIQFCKIDTTNIDIEEIKTPTLIKELVDHHNNTIMRLLDITKDKKLRELAFDALLSYNMEELNNEEENS